MMNGHALFFISIITIKRPPTIKVSENIVFV